MAISHIFQGSWLTNQTFADLEPLQIFHRQLDKSVQIKEDILNQHILFRKSFSLEKAPAHATLFVTADDFYKLYVNGRFVAQGPTSCYSFSYNYNTLDITPYLHEGTNTLAFHTYYLGYVNRVFVSADHQHGLLCDLVADGKTILSSDESFKTAVHTAHTAIGEVGYHTGFMERYDANAPEVDFELPEYDDSAWTNALKRKHLRYTLKPQPSEMVVTESFEPVHTEVRGDTLFADFGQTLVGNLFFQAKGPKGSLVSIRMGQELKEDGTVRHEMRCNCVYHEEFVLSDRKTDAFVPYDYKSFRYAEIKLPQGCTVVPGSLVFQARHYPFELKAKFQGRNELEKKIWDLCVRSLQYGTQEVLMDCMDREKGYYLGDGCYTLITRCVLTKDFSLFPVFYDDFLRTKFITPTLVTCANCGLVQEIGEYPLIMVFTLLAWEHLTHDIPKIRTYIPAMKELLDNYAKDYAREDGMLVNLDKWLVVEWPDNFRDGYDVDLQEGKLNPVAHVALEAYYIGAIKALNRLCVLCGEPIYRDSTALEETFMRLFYDQEAGLYRDCESSSHHSFPGNMFPYFFELIPEERFKQNALAMIKEKRLTCSLLFTSFPTLAALQRDGEEELLHDLITDAEAWPKMLADGATTSFEGWCRESKWNTSLFHLTLSDAAAFLADFRPGDAFHFSLPEVKHNA